MEWPPVPMSSLSFLENVASSNVIGLKIGLTNKNIFGRKLTRVESKIVSDYSRFDKV